MHNIRKTEKAIIKKAIIIFLVSFFCTMPATATPVAISNSSIVAIVGEEPITMLDLNTRIKFILATTSIAADAESVSRIRPQILRALIDERLQKQEALRNEIETSDKEIEQAIASIERQREMPAGTIAKTLVNNKIPESVLIEQVRAQILWSKLITKKLRAQIKISDEDIVQMKRRLSVAEVKQELKIAILQLPVDKPARDDEVRKAAEKLVLEARGGADFEALVRQFSGGTAREGGQISTFWIRPEELDPFIARVIGNAKAGTVTEPLKNSAGYTIIKIYETRDIPSQQTSDTEINFKEIFIKPRSSSGDFSAEKLKAISEEIAKKPGNCLAKNIGDVQEADLVSIAVKNITSLMSDLPDSLKLVAGGMKIGDVSAPFVSEEGITIYMLCNKREGVSVIITDERARAAVYQQRMELEAQKYMRNLRHDTFIEIRTQ